MHTSDTSDTSDRGVARTVAVAMVAIRRRRDRRDAAFWRTLATCTLLVVAAACGSEPFGSDSGPADSSARAPEDASWDAMPTIDGGTDATPADAPLDAPRPNPCAAHGGRTYYVAPTGSDGSPGTLSAPFATVRYGATVLKAGDTLCVRAGTYTQEVAIRSSGAPGAPIVLSAYPGERPIIDPGPTGAGFWNAVYPCAWVEIRGFEIRNGVHGIVYDNAQHWTIDDNWIHDNGSLNTAQDHAHQGIAGGGADMVLTRNVVYHNGWPPYTTNQNHGMYITGHRYLIANNVFYANEAWGLQIAAYGCGKDCKGSDFSGAVDWTVANNVFASQMTRGGIVVWLPGAAYGDQIGADLRNIDIVNNVFYENWTGGTGGSSNGVDFCDEFGSSYPAGVNWSSVLVATNLAYSKAGKRTFGGDKVPFTVQNILEGADPLFFDPTKHDFRLRAGSPAIGAGRNLTALGASVDVDFTGYVRPASGAWDLGPYAYR